jgi:2-polyprenyl-3-methyl-5-hydroxy-6-metoxy-1,4-benzoquinol methylase
LTNDNYYELFRPEIFQLVPGNTRNFLDIGCGFGSLGSQVRESYGSRTIGIEFNSEATIFLNERLDKHFIADIETFDFSQLDMDFDCIVLADILEHLVDPWKTLSNVKSHLADTGVMIVSIPNIRNLNVIGALILKGVWSYQDSGILDRTHLRFFTKQTMISMFEDLDLEVVEQARNIDQYKFPRNIFSFIPNSIIPDLRVSQFIFVLKSRTLSS